MELNRVIKRKEKFGFLYASHHEHMEKTYIKALKDVKKTQQNHHRNEMEYHDDAILAFSNCMPLFLIQMFTLFAASLHLSAFCTPKPFIEFKCIKKFQSQDGKQFGTE